MAINVVVLIPGYTGSELYAQDGNVVWPVQGANINTLALERTDLKVGRVIQDKSNGDPLYAQMGNLFSDNGYSVIRYQTNDDEFDPDPYVNGNSFIEFPYDWRRTNLDVDSGDDSPMLTPGSANRLQVALTDIHNTYSQFDDQYNLYFFCHSMGGLVLRNLFDISNVEDNGWFKHVKWACTLATPHLGSPTAFAAVVDEFNWGMLDGLALPAKTVQSLIDMKDLSGGVQLNPYFQTTPNRTGWPFIYNTVSKTYTDLSDPTVLDLSDPTNPQGWVAAFLKDSIVLPTPLENMVDAQKMFNTLNYSPKVEFNCWYSKSYTPQDDVTDDGLTAIAFTIDDENGKNLQVLRESEQGDGLVTPYSGSFGTDTSFRDANGAQPLPQINVKTKVFTNIAHVDMVTDDQIYEAIKSEFPELGIEVIPAAKINN